MSTRARPVGGPLATRPFQVLSGLALLALILVAWRFAVGLGPATGLSDGYPWGLWIAFDVVTGTALACGGYAVAILVYVLNRGRYHPLVRPAILTSALGYSLAAVAIVIDVGRPWHLWRIPLGGFPEVGGYNWSSALLEVALCVMAYIVVLWLELAPALLERWREGGRPGLARFAAGAHAFLEKGFIWIAAAGLLLPTMHQSSLGSVMLLAGPRLHPLWNTPMLPLLFLISCLTMGAAMVVFESTLAGVAFKRPLEIPMLRSLYGAAAVTVWAYLAIRLVDLVARGRLGTMLTPDLYAGMFWLETALLVAAVVPYHRRRAMAPAALFRGAIFLALAGALYRFDSYLVAFQPGEEWSYFPTLPELLITLGIIAAEIALYVAIVKRFPILGGRAAAPAR